MIKLFNTRNDIILKRIEALIREINKCTDNHIWGCYNRAICRMWNLYGAERKKK